MTALQKAWHRLLFTGMPRARMPGGAGFRASARGGWRRAGLVALLLGVGAPRADDDPEGRNALLALLDTETRLATKNGMNADFVPGMATIMTGNELLARGARTVWEALALMPGIAPGLEFTGERQLIARGIGYGYASGNFKLLLDGQALNTTLQANANPLLNLPLEQVERIEAIRGPGAALHGEYAFAGVVDVITRQRGRAAFLQAAENGAHGGGLRGDWRVPEQSLAVSFNAVALEGRGGVPVAADAAHARDRPEVSHAPGHSNEALRYRALLARLDWGAWSAVFDYLDDAYGDHFGVNHFLPPDGGRLTTRHQVLTGRLERDWILSERLQLNTQLALLRHERDRNWLHVFPAGWLSDAAIFLNQDYEEQRWQGDAELHWQASARHRLKFGLEASQIDVRKASWEWPTFLVPLPRTWLDEATTRRILSAFAQEEYRASERLTLTGSVRYDEYQDVGGLFSPRLAAVWRLSPARTVKLQYARAFRPPTFYESAYAVPEAKMVASAIETFELGYILRQAQWETRWLLFHSTVEQPLGFDWEREGYANREDVRLRGVEVEHRQRLGPQLRLDANLSYVAARDEQGERLAGGAEWLGNLAVLWRPREPWTAALQLRHVGTRARPPEDPPPPVAAYTTLDFTLTRRPLGAGFLVRLGIKNLTDADVRDPELPTSFGGIPLSYEDDYPRPGRRFWLSVGYAFD